VNFGGASNPFQLRGDAGSMGIEGLADMPTVVGGDTEASRVSGQYRGFDKLSGRSITVTLDIGPCAGTGGTFTNLVLNPSFEYDTPLTAPAAWTAQIPAGAGTITKFEAVSNTAYVGSNSTWFVATGLTAGDFARASTLGGTGGMPVTPGLPYSFGAWIIGNTLAVGASYQIQILWWTAAGANISAAGSAGSSSLAYNHQTLLNQVAPPTAAYVSLGVIMFAGSSGGGSDLNFDAVEAVQSATLPAYFDGDTTSYEWSGTPGNSTSIPVPGWGIYGQYGSTPSGPMKALRNALSPPPDGVTEYPLFFQLSASSPMLCTMVRGRKRSTLIDIPYVLGGLAQNVPIQFWATDPTLYAAGTLDPSVGVPAPLGGFGFPMSFNLSFGGGVEYGSITATNSGDLPCFPLITFTGPMTTPTLTNASLTNSPFLQFGMALNTGDTLVVNTDPKYPSAQYTAGTTQSASRLYTLTQASTWWAIAPGSNALQFTTSDVVSVAGTCAVEYSSAYSAAS